MDKETKVDVRLTEVEILKIIKEEFIQYDDYDNLNLDSYKFVVDEDTGQITLELSYYLMEKVDL